MSKVLDAAEQALMRTGEPLHINDLTERMLDWHLWATSGKTPSATVESMLAVDMKRPDTRFARTAPRTYALRSWDLDSFVKSKPQGMTYLDAAEAVLESMPGRDPVSYRSITSEAIERGWLTPSGSTPAQTMYVSLMTDVARRERRGEQARFVQLPKGLFGLAGRSETGLGRTIAENNRRVKDSIHDRLQSMPPDEFEKLIGALLTAMGFDVEVTSYGGDGGVDVRATLIVNGVVRTQMAIQAKRWRANVQAPTVQQLRGSLGVHDQGLIITTSDFSSGARSEAAKPDRAPVALMNGGRLIDLLVEYEIGVARSKVVVLELAQEDDADTIVPATDEPLI